VLALRSRHVAAVLLVLAVPGVALAGMPSIDLTDVAALRLRGISFFGLVLLASAAAIQAIWNSLRPEFPRLPRLSYPRALGLVALWGLLFLLVLTMISGARELMTPGAWKKDGATYKLVEPGDAVEPERRQRLSDLKTALWTWAQAHGGELPANLEQVPGDFWRVVAHKDAARFVYAPGQRVGASPAPVAWEPSAYGARRLALLANGEIVIAQARELEPR
jgi:hypothetical protein